MAKLCSISLPGTVFSETTVIALQHREHCQSPGTRGGAIVSHPKGEWQQRAEAASDDDYYVD